MRHDTPADSLSVFFDMPVIYQGKTKSLRESGSLYATKVIGQDYAAVIAEGVETGTVPGGTRQKQRPATAA